jgi:hypothetical protein
MSVETSGIVVVVCGTVEDETLVGSVEVVDDFGEKVVVTTLSGTDEDVVVTGSVVVVVSSSTGELVEELVDELDEVLDPSGSVVVSDGVVVDGVLPSSQ